MTKPEFIARQSRCPTGLLGGVVARVMARETRAENRRALDLLDLEDGDSLLDIGCGHGETLRYADRMVRLSRGVGVDFSGVMVRLARKRNRAAVWDTRLSFHCADSANLPSPNNRFSKALSVHTVYFWSDPAAHLAEAFRILIPGGRFLLCYRSSADARALKDYPDTIYRFPSVAEVEKELAKAGFASIQTETADISGRLTHWTISRRI